MFYAKEDFLDIPTANSSATYINSKVDSFEEVEKKLSKQTFTEKLMKVFELHGTNNCLGYRKVISPTVSEDKYTFFNYSEIKAMSENFIYNLRKNKLIEEHDFGSEEGIHKFIGIYSKNCVEWIVSDVGCQFDAITVVTLYNTLGDLAFEHIFNQTLLSTVCISPENIKTVLKYKEKFNIKCLKNIILFDLTLTLTNEEIEPLAKAGLNVFKFSDLIKPVSSEERKNYPLTAPKPESIITISYTSGTTNLPKGAKISQRQICCQLYLIPDSGISISEKDIHFSYLPLAHIMERVSISLILSQGGQTGFISGDVRKTLSEDVKLLHPTYFIAVPKVLANFRDMIMLKISNLTGCSRSLVERALRVKRENFDDKKEITDGLYDSLVLNKIHNEFGGKWRFIITGSAPLSVELGIEIKLIFGCPIVEAYGMTEVGGGSHVMHVNDTVNGHVGGPGTPVKIKFVDVPELNYTKDTKTGNESTPCGEICVKGPCLFSGYFCDKENTNKIIDKDGWLHTGDVGMVFSDQKKFKIIDRIKEIFKLVQGEYIAPSKLEMVYSKSEYVSQICVYGQSTMTYVIAVIAPKKHEVVKFLKEKNILKDGEEPEIHYENAELLADIKRSLDKLATAHSFNTLEKIGKIVLTKVEFTIENELLTPTAKLVRRKIETMFKTEINKVYV
jgi:long-chain acyl-CoA synthetase